MSAPQYYVGTIYRNSLCPSRDYRAPVWRKLEQTVYRRVYFKYYILLLYSAW